MAELAAEGRVRHLGLSDVAPEQVLAAHRAHPIAAVQAEWSLWPRDVERELLPGPRGLGIGMVPWGPLGNGFLAGAADGGLGAGDVRHRAPRSAGNLAERRDRFAPLRAMAAEKDVIPAQLALARLLAQGDDVVPTDDLRRLDELAPAIAAAGAPLMG